LRFGQELRPILRRADARHIVRQEHLDFHEGTLGGQPVALLALALAKNVPVSLLR